MRKQLLAAILTVAPVVYMLAQDGGAAVTLPMPEPRPVVVGEPDEPWYKSVQLNGFAMLGYQAVSQDGARYGSFGVSLARLAVGGSVDGGRAGVFNWKTQLQVNGSVESLGSSARLIDAYVEWRKFECLRITAGEFTIPFTLENLYHPLDVGFADNAQAVLKFAGCSDRSGRRSSNGRDIGVCLEGDALFAADGHPFLHYALAIVNGQGINTRDVDDNKMAVGQVWVSPLSGLRVSLSLLEGSVAREGELRAADGSDSATVVRSLHQHRYAIGAEWDSDPLVVRSEYVHSTGSAFAVRDDGHTRDLTLSGAGSKADAFYAMALVRILRSTLPGRLRLKGRYDLYRPEASMASAQTALQFGADYWFTPKVGVAVEYTHANDRALARHNYNYYDFQVQFRF